MRRLRHTPSVRNENDFYVLDDSKEEKKKTSEKEWQRETLVLITPAITISLMLSVVHGNQTIKLLRWISFSLHCIY